MGKKTKGSKPPKPDKVQPKTSSEKARKILEKEMQAREQRCGQRIAAILEEEGFKLDIKPQIVLIPLR